MKNSKLTWVLAEAGCRVLPERFLGVGRCSGPWRWSSSKSDYTPDLGTHVLARSAVLTAYVMLTVSQVIKRIELFCRCRGMGGRSCTDVAVSCLPLDAGSVHLALVSALASATSSQGHEAAANAWAAGTEEPEVSLPLCNSLSQPERAGVVHPGVCCPARLGAMGEPLCSQRPRSLGGFSPQSRSPQSSLT